MSYTASKGMMIDPKMRIPPGVSWADFLRTSALKRDAANPLILFIFSSLTYWLDRRHGDSDGGIERRRWRRLGWAWAMPPGSVICIQPPTQIRKNTSPYSFLHRWHNKNNNIATPPVLSTTSYSDNNKLHRQQRSTSNNTATKASSSLYSAIKAHRLCHPTLPTTQRHRGCSRLF